MAALVGAVVFLARRKDFGDMPLRPLRHRGQRRVRAAPMSNGDLVAASIHFGGMRAGAEMSLDGVDVLRVAGGKITEVWLYSADQDAEDAFWG